MSNEVKTKEKVNMDPKYIIKLTVTLLLTCMVVAGLLGWVNSITKDKIAAITWESPSRILTNGSKSRQKRVRIPQNSPRLPGARSRRS